MDKVFGVRELWCLIEEYAGRDMFRLSDTSKDMSKMSVTRRYRVEDRDIEFIPADARYIFWCTGTWLCARKFHPGCRLSLRLTSPLKSACGSFGVSSSIVVLDVSRTQYVDFSLLKECCNLEVFRAAGSDFRDFGDLSSSLQLRVVDVSYTRVLYVPGVSRWPLLESLNLEGTGASCIGLSGVSGLRELRLARMTLCRSVDVLWCFESLVALDISYTRVDDLFALSSCLELRKLKMVGTRVKSLRPLKELHLVELDLRDTTVSVYPICGRMYEWKKDIWRSRCEKTNLLRVLCSRALWALARRSLRGVIN